MNRFSRLVTLRNLKEESAAQGYSREVSVLAALRQNLETLDEETRQARQDEVSVIAERGQRLDPRIYEDFYRGQAWRREKIELQINETKVRLEQARQKWFAARTKLKQSEKLEEREDLSILKQHNLRELKEMDQQGVDRFNRDQR